MPSFLTNYSFTLLFSWHLHRKSNVLTFFYFFTFFIWIFTYFYFLLTLQRKNCRALRLFKCFHSYFLFRRRFLFFIYLFLRLFFSLSLSLTDCSSATTICYLFRYPPSISLSLSEKPNLYYYFQEHLTCPFLPSLLACFLPSWQRWWELIKPHIMATVCLPTNRCRSLPHVSDTCFSPR